MATADGPTGVLAAFPDPRELLGSWDEISNQISAQSTAWSRDAFATGLRLYEQNASNTGECLESLAQSARRLGELARATEHRIGAANDVAGVWNLELGLLGDAAQMAAALGQDTWLSLVRAQTELMQSAWAQSSQTAEQILRSTQQCAAPTPVASDVPALLLAKPPWAAWAETATQGTQAWWNAMAATAAAAQAPAGEGAVPADVASSPKSRARRRSR